MAHVRDTPLSVDRIRPSLDRARAEAGFTPGAFEPFLARLPALIDLNQQLHYDDYVAHGLTDLVGRFVVRADRTSSVLTFDLAKADGGVSRVQAVVDAVHPTQTFPGLPLSKADLASRFVPDFFKGLGIGTALVVLLVIAAF